MEKSRMQKVTPDPPNADNVSAQESPRTEKPGDATDRNVDDAHLTFAHLKALPRQPSTFFIVNPELPVQDLLGFASEAAASACVIITDKADQESGSIRNTLLGLELIISAIEISVNRALDHLDPIE
jgi:hypothetical protein